ncbi:MULTISPECIES: lytic transglycosylase domain-containing protein [Pseudomonas syringae group]|uniref:lytic transglycosylase domain-containing protein n=1 Tax=Pseudomonas syringae group TaxID=136849 RepID=UPI000EFEA936|nr:MULTISPECIES: lytic transglycosylase domain-containing protein [Pseudomonas syringae group]MDH4602483.1 lytic transglycosylase domain-containing protein [Pseudomonas syringae pv. papulans]
MLKEWAEALCLVGALIGSSFGIAAEHVTPMTSECIQKAASSYSIHPDVLYAILMVEGGTVGKNSKPNTNGSYDIGPAQINSMHRARLAALNISEDELRNNGCTNITVAAWHLSTVLTTDVLQSVTDQESYLRAIARYHSATPIYNEIYAGKLRAAFAVMYSGENK